MLLEKLLKSTGLSEIDVSIYSHFCYHVWYAAVSAALYVTNVTTLPSVSMAGEQTVYRKFYGEQICRCNESLPGSVETQIFSRTTVMRITTNLE